ncbi:hypothetical protein, partial [Thiolapillus sp.]
TPRSEAYFVFPLAQGTPGKQCGLAATGVYQPSLRSPWLAAIGFLRGFITFQLETGAVFNFDPAHDFASGCLNCSESSNH